MTKEELAAQINGRKHRNEITESEAALVKAAGLVVVFGYSDDIVIMAGAISEQLSAYEGTTINVTPLGCMPSFDSLIESDAEEAEFEDYFKKKAVDQKAIEATWHEVGDFSWTFETTIPHASFVITDEEGPFCRGIVFDINQLTDDTQTSLL